MFVDHLDSLLAKLLMIPRKEEDVAHKEGGLAQYRSIHKIISLQSIVRDAELWDLVGSALL